MMRCWLGRVKLIERARALRADAGEVGTPVTHDGLELIVRGALVALESENMETAKVLLAGYLAMSTEANVDAPDGATLN